VKLAARYQVRRESGADWCVVRGTFPVATGLDLAEAEQIADQWNRKKKQGVKTMPKLTYADREEIDFVIERQMKPLYERAARNRREYKQAAEQRAAAEQQAAAERRADEAKRRARLEPLIEAVKIHGHFTAYPEKISALLGFPAVKSQADLLSFIEPERQTLMANGIRYFAHTGGIHHRAITFRLLELDSATHSRTSLR
jgi:hypothetical protein